MAKGDFLGEFEIYVLLAVKRLGDDAYGITIRRAIDERTGREVAIEVMDMVRLESGRIVERWGGMGQGSVIEQLGAIPEPP